MKDRLPNHPRARHAACTVGRWTVGAAVALEASACTVIQPINQPAVPAKVEAAPEKAPQYVEPQELITTIFEATKFPAVVTGEHCDIYQLGYIVMPAAGAVGARRTIKNADGTDFKPPAELPPGQVEETVSVTETTTLTVSASQYDESGNTIGNTGGTSLHFECNGNTVGQ